MTNEEIINCPICQTIYHSEHLIIWLKIKKKCPICKNQIRNKPNKGVFVTNSIHQNKITNSGTLPIRWNYLNLECPHCHTSIDLSVKTTSDQCQICGSNIYWINRAQNLKSKMKNFNNLYSKIHQKKGRKREKINKFKIKQINKRKIERIKEQERNHQKELLREQTRLELLEDVLLINREYFREKANNLLHAQDFPKKVYDEVNSKEKHAYHLKMAIIMVINLFIIPILILGLFFN